MRYRDIPPYGLRLQPQLKEKLEVVVKAKKAETPDWSLNSEIAQRLEESFEARNELKDFNDGELIQELINRYGRDGIFILVGKAANTFQKAFLTLKKQIGNLDDE
jgi:hypothetical protein